MIVFFFWFFINPEKVEKENRKINNKIIESVDIYINLNEKNI